MKLYRAVVEDNNDPLKNSRVRVRILGIHTSKNENSNESFNFISSNELPWAETVGSEFGLIGGVGLSTVLRQGTWVWVILDHDNPNAPTVIGCIKGTTKKRTKYKAGEGFNDKDEIYPFDATLNESDLNRLARNEKLLDPVYDTPHSVYNSTDTAHKQINDNIDAKLGIIDGVSGADVSQTEPNSLNDLSSYPDVSVLETPSGHIIEFDDTTGNERVRLRHTSGSYIEIRPDGTFVQKSVNTNSASHYIHMSDVKKHIAKGVKEYIEQNKEEIIGGSLLSNVKGNLKLHVEGNLTWDVGGTVTITSGGNYKVQAPRVDLN